VKGDVPLHLFDVFERLQSPDPVSDPGSRAQEVRTLFGSFHTPQKRVEELLAPFDGVVFHAGVFPQTSKGLESERFAFVHVDLDHEGSTFDALSFFHPRLVRGGIIVGDDYNDSGVARAFRRYFTDRPETLLTTPWGQVVVVRL
jgi:hypothetical protein